MTADDGVILDVRDLRTYFFSRQGVGRAVDGVSFSVARGETLGLVGESGCGKTITSLSIVRLLPRASARITGGQVVFQGEDLLAKSEAEMRQYRGRHIAMILQDPMAALNPVFTIGDQVMEPIRLHQHVRRGTLKARAIEILRLLRVPAPETRLGCYPHEFSGGMRQRVVGAIGLSCRPELLIADEPTTSLDATVQAQYLRLLRRIQRDQALAIIFITHDFGIVARMCDRVAVMYAGRIVETATTRDLFREPAHPYTEALLGAVPAVGGGARKRLRSIEGQPPSIYRLPQGCPFAPRCERAEPRCAEEYPAETAVGPLHTARCWRLA